MSLLGNGPRLIRDIRLAAHQEYAGWANFAGPHSGSVRFGTAERKADGDVLFDANADFTTLKPETASTIHIAPCRAAQQIADQYQVILTREDGEWYGRGLELPHVFADGETPAECAANTRQAFVSTVAYMLEKAQRPPSPAREGRRTEQVNVRLTAEERIMLERSARRKGFTGLSDFVRSAALESATR